MRERMNLPKGVSLNDITFSQEGDSCDEPDNVQYLDIKIEDAGAGKYFIINTERWAFDNINDLIVLFEGLMRKTK